ncbi:hypothetical protein LZ30DRAFT_726784 [Colletotrichum cereale]|nr:hypothetical protein LZ30DRAFT_726784 [Colletotrichum cereale]
MFTRYSVLTLGFLMLVNSIFLPPSSQSLSVTLNRPLQKRETRQPTAAIVGGKAGKGREEFCDKSQAQRIVKDLEWMHELAGSAIKFLQQPDSHMTAAYIAWFGEANAYKRKAADIRDEIYKSIWNIGKRDVSYAESVRHGTYKAVVFGCFPQDPESCKDKTLAVAVDGRHSYVMLCPGYFELSKDYEGAFASWREERKDIDVGGQILLHEMLHQRIVVGWDGYANDFCYSPEGCMQLHDSEKIKNAENYALFALEVKANPARAKLQVDMTSSEGKGEIARKLLKPSGQNTY